MWPAARPWLLGAAGVLLYLMSWVPTQITTMELLREHQPPACVPGIVHRLLVSDAVLYQDWTQSSHPGDWERYYLVILHDDGTQSIREVAPNIAERVRPYARWNCEPTTRSNRGSTT